MQLKPYKWLIKLARGKYVISRKDKGNNILSETTFGGKDIRFDLKLGKYFELEIRIKFPFKETKL